MAELEPLIPCDCCETAREFPDLTRPVFSPRCLWCGARYVAQLGAWPPHIGADARKKWRGEVLDTWEKYGHDRGKLRELATSGIRPLAPREDRRKR